MFQRHIYEFCHQLLHRIYLTCNLCGLVSLSFLLRGSRSTSCCCFSYFLIGCLVILYCIYLFFFFTFASTQNETPPRSSRELLLILQLDEDRHDIFTEDHLAPKQPDVSPRSSLTENLNKGKLNINVDLVPSNS